jgi:hypothetical protein
MRPRLAGTEQVQRVVAPRARALQGVLQWSAQTATDYPECPHTGSSCPERIAALRRGAFRTWGKRIAKSPCPCRRVSCAPPSGRLHRHYEIGRPKMGPGRSRKRDDSRGNSRSPRNPVGIGRRNAPDHRDSHPRGWDCHLGWHTQLRRRYIAPCEIQPYRFASAAEANARRVLIQPVAKQSRSSSETRPAT